MQKELLGTSEIVLSPRRRAHFPDFHRSGKNCLRAAARNPCEAAPEEVLGSKGGGQKSRFRKCVVLPGVWRFRVRVLERFRPPPEVPMVFFFNSGAVFFHPFSEALFGGALFEALLAGVAHLLSENDDSWRLRGGSGGFFGACFGCVFCLRGGPNCVAPF